MLLHEMQQYSFNDIEDLIEFIQSECGPYLSQTERQMYRGIRPLGADVVVTHQQKGRSPTDTSNDIHEIVDQAFLAKFGHQFRSDVLFGTGYQANAEDYGSVLSIIIPIGNFEFLWSAKVPDMYDVTSTLDNAQHSMDDEEFKKGIIQFIDSSEYQMTDLNSALKSHNEIMLNCPRGYITLTEANVRFFSDGNMHLSDIWSAII